MVRYYIIAGISIRIHFPKEYCPAEDGILEAFRISETEKIAREIFLKAVDTVAAPDGECVYRDYAKMVYRREKEELRYIGAVEKTLKGAYARILRKEEASYVQIKKSEIHDRITAKMILDVLEAEHLVVSNHGFLLHASYILWKGRGILFTAPSGTGKSTQAELWKSLRGAEIVNGDRAAVLCEQDGIFVHGIPYAGSSGICKNIKAPLTAIVYLSQSPRTTLSILEGIMAFRHIWEGCCVNSWSREDLSACTESVLQVIKHVPVYALACTPDESAVEILEQVL